MHFIVVALIYALEGLFAVGILGSAVVLLLTLIEDAKMLFEREEKAPVRKSASAEIRDHVAVPL